MAVPFNYPKNTTENKKFVRHKLFITMGDVVAEELQDPNSEASVFLDSLRNTRTHQHLLTESLSVNGTPLENPKYGSNNIDI